MGYLKVFESGVDGPQGRGCCASFSEFRVWGRRRSVVFALDLPRAVVMMSVCGELVCMQMHATGDGKTSQERVVVGEQETVGKELSGRATGQLHVFGLIIISLLTSHSSTLSHLLSRPTPTPSRPDAHRARAISAHSLPSPTIRSVTSPLASQSLTRRLCSQD
jgi:hypothetical protein